MGTLLLTDDLARVLIGALVTVGRIDGDLEPSEIGAMRTCAQTLAPTLAFDDEWLLMTEVTPQDLAAAVVAGEGAFRSAGTSTRAEIAESFVQIAIELCAADGSPNELELGIVRSFAEHLGAAQAILDRLDAMAKPVDGSELD
jgi:tellurite resistance protein